MTQRQTNIIWGVLVVILIGIIAYMAVDQKDSDQEYAEQIPQNNQPIKDEDKVVDSKVEDSKTVIKSEPVAEKVALKTYTNPVYNYSFKYPSQYELRAESNRGQYLVDQLNTHVVFATQDDAQLSFADFMFKRVKLHCDADGVGSSTTCPKYAEEPVAFKTNSGLNAYKLVFVEETTKTVNGKNPIVTKGNKTMYAIDLGVGPALEGGTNRLILSIIPINLELGKEIALSVEKTK